jgi:hypothetical protein
MEGSQTITQYLWRLQEDKKKKLASPFKFNSDWLKEEGFISLIKEHWTPIDQND